MTSSRELGWGSGMMYLGSWLLRSFSSSVSCCLPLSEGQVVRNLWRRVAVQPVQGVGHIPLGGLVAVGVAPGVFVGTVLLAGLWDFGRDRESRRGLDQDPRPSEPFVLAFRASSLAIRSQSSFMGSPAWPRTWVKVALGRRVSRRSSSHISRLATAFFPPVRQSFCCHLASQPLLKPLQTYSESVPTSTSTPSMSASWPRWASPRLRPSFPSGCWWCWGHVPARGCRRAEVSG